MTAVATTFGTFNSEKAIARARKILDEDRALTGAEEQAAHDDLYRCQEAGNFRALAELKMLYAEIERISSHRAQEARVAAAVAAQTQRDEHERKRPERWAALSPAMRAALVVADELNDSNVAKALLRFARLTEDPGTANLAPPATFEPRSW